MAFLDEKAENRETIGYEPKPQHAKKITDEGTLAQCQDIHFSLQIKCIE